jgi:hypothetical protein
MTDDPLARFRLTQCPKCGYDLRGSHESESCPECGFERIDALTINRRPIPGWLLPTMVVISLLLLGWSIVLAIRLPLTPDSAIAVALSVICLSMSLIVLSDTKKRWEFVRWLMDRDGITVCKDRRRPIDQWPCEPWSSCSNITLRLKYPPVGSSDESGWRLTVLLDAESDNPRHKLTWGILRLRGRHRFAVSFDATRPEAAALRAQLEAWRAAAHESTEPNATAGMP